MAQDLGAGPPAALAALEDGWAQLREGRIEEAGRQFARAREASTAAGEESLRWTALLGLGDVAAQRGEFEVARESWRTALAGGDPGIVARAGARLALLEGALALRRGEADLACRRLDEALAAARSSGDAFVEIRAAANLADAALEQGETDGALAGLAAAVPLAEGAGDRIGLGLLLRGTGRAHAARGEFGPARDAFHRSLELARDVGNDRLAALNLQDLAIVHGERREFVAALRAYDETLELAPDNPRLRAYTLNGMAVLYARQGNLELARDAFAQAAAAFAGIGDRDGALMASSNLGSVALDAGEPATALAAFQGAIESAGAAGDAAELPALWAGVGRSHAEIGDLDAAEAAFRRSLDLSARTAGGGPRRAAALHGLARVLLARGRPAEALLFADEAAGAAGFDDALEGRTVAGLALAALGRTVEAERALAEAATAAEDAGHELLGGAIERAEGFAALREPFERWTELLIDAGRVEEALVVSERARARVLLEALAGSADPRGVARELSEAELGEEGALAARLVTLNRERLDGAAAAERRNALAADLARARADLEAFRLRLYAAHPALSTRRADFRPERLDLAALLDAETALVAFAVHPQRSFVFVLRRGADGRPAVTVRELALAGPALAVAVERFGARLAERSPAAAPLARSLYRELLAPVEAQLAGAARLGLVPDGPLWQVPFPALEDGEGRLLLDRFATFQCPSLTYLGEARRLALRRAALPAGPELLAVGDPAFSPEAAAFASRLRGAGSLGRLPDAEREVRELAQLYEVGSSLVLTGAAAAETRVREAMGRARVLHFATHALLDDRGPLYSILLLAPDPAAGGQDGLLEAWEIEELPLAADLVVLAGCQTARRPGGSGVGGGGGGGIVGLAWAFAAAGSPTTVATQWPVDSAATRTLMVELHRRLRAGVPKAAALQQAQQALSREPRTRHPFYWASFVVLGDG